MSIITCKKDVEWEEIPTKKLWKFKEGGENVLAHTTAYYSMRGLEIYWCIMESKKYVNTTNYYSGRFKIMFH